ncbi:MAG: site-2 protease family protein [Candidatus Hodarchaeales archaeon]|jgi:Zn-dependent protease
MKYSFTILKIRGIPIELHITFIGLLGLLFILSFPIVYPVLLFGLLFISVIVHELAHSFVAQRNNIPVKKIVLYPIGGAAQIEDIPEKPGIEARMALVGPLTSLFIGIVSLGVNFLYPISFSTIPIFVWSGSLFFDLGVLNILLALFNLIPAFPMDGGRALRAILTHLRKDFVKATENAAAVGRGFAFLMIFLGIMGNIWFAIIGFFIYLGATQEVRMARISAILKPIRVGDVMLDRDSALTAPPTMVLSQALELMYQAQVRDLIVCTEYELTGVLTWDDLLKIPSTLRLITRIGDLEIKPLSIKSENSVFDAYKVMLQEKARLIPVVHPDAPCNFMGVITNQSISYSLGIGKNEVNPLLFS